MNRLLAADFYRMYKSRRFWICLASMGIIAVAFIIMQYTAMDYIVAIDRVLFLPMSFYGVCIAALISLFVGTDFSDGFIRNKLIVGRKRNSIYLSNLVVSWTACLIIYIFTIAVTMGIGRHLFENNVTVAGFSHFFLLGMFTCLAFGSIFCMLSMLIGEKSTSVMICMGLAFGMLFLCLRTNQILVQEEYKNGMLNPYYVSGVQRILCELLHDFNPFGQVAQLSSMKYLNPVRWIVADLFWMAVAAGLGRILFKGRDIR